jgi:hypothetical protein
MARRPTSPVVSLTVAQALSALTTLDAKRAATFNPADNTVRVMKKQYNRRANGQIIGANFENPEGWWVETRVDVRECAQYAIDKNNASRANYKIEIARTEKFISEHVAKLVELDAQRVGLDAYIAANPDKADLFAGAVSTHANTIAGVQETLERFRTELADMESRLAALPVV